MTNSPRNSYVCIRNRSRSNSKDMTSPLKNLASLRSSREGVSMQNSIKRSSESKGSHRRKSSKTSQYLSNGYISEDKKYSLFTTKEKSNIVIACDNAIPGKVINENLQEEQDLKYFTNSVIGQDSTFMFNFDQVFNETQKQEKFYASAIRPSIKNFIEGKNTSILLFGPSEGGKTFSLKGKTGIERGIVPRAVEDIFNIVKNSEESFEDMDRAFRPDYDEYPQQDSSRETHQIKHGKIVSSKEQNLPERMFLKVAIYQIYVDKVLDLLQSSSHASSSRKAKIDHYLDKESDEVVSRLKNITEKVVFTLEDFYSVLQDGFKNRRVESLNMQEQHLRKKSHLIINLSLMKRTPSKRIHEISSLNFVELSGSEQAVSEETFYNNQSVKQFVSKSFNSLSAQIMKASVSKKTSIASEEGDSKIVNCLRNTLTNNSNIVIICCVSAGQQEFEHSLPAVKFCARIRDSVLKRINNSKNKGQYSTRRKEEIQDEVNYNLETDRSYLKAKIEQLKQQIIDKQIQTERGINMDVQRWIHESMQQVDDMTRKIKFDNPNYYQDKNSLILIDELDFLKQKINKISLSSYRSINEQNAYYEKNQTLNRDHRDHQMYSTQSTNRQAYNPFASESPLKTQSPSNDYRQYQSQQKYQEYPVRNSREQYMNINDNQDNFYKQDNINSLKGSQLKQEKHDTATTANFNRDYQTDSRNYQTEIRNYQGQTKNYNEDLQKSSKNTKIRPRELSSNQKQKQSYQSENQNHFQKPQVFEIETILDSGMQQQLNQPTIQVYEQSSIAQNATQQYRSNQSKSKYKSSQMVGSPYSSAENDFLNKAHPALEMSLTGEKNNISLSQDKISPQKQVRIREDNNSMKKSSQQQFRPNPGNQKQYNTIQKNQPSKIMDKSTELSSKRQQIQNDSVYTTSEEALNDINRLIKLNDMEGLKKRVLQIYKEKSDQDDLLNQQEQQIAMVYEQFEKKEETLQKYQKDLSDSNQQFSATIGELNAEKQQKEKDYKEKKKSLKEQLKENENKVKLLQEEKDKMKADIDQLKDEIKNLEQSKEESENKFGQEKQEADKLRANYTVLKEHEMNVILELEGKKTKEISVYEQTITDLGKSIKEREDKERELEEQIFQLKEDLRSNQFDLEKSGVDRRYMTEQIEKLGQKLEKVEDEKEYLIRNQDEQQMYIRNQQDEKMQIDQEKEKAFEEIEKLHQLIEEMEKSIELERNIRKEEVHAKEEMQKQIELLEKDKQELESIIQKKDQEIENYQQNEEQLQIQMQSISKALEESDRTCTVIKAKEYDKVDVIRKNAELEAKIKYLQVDNENLVKERNNFDIANVEMSRNKSELEAHNMALESELDYFKRTHEELLDKFDEKIEQVTVELAKLKNENILLKEKEKSIKKTIKELEEERDEFQMKMKLAENKSEDQNKRLIEMEREVRTLMLEREREIKDNQIKTSIELQNKEENKRLLLEDIQNLIKDKRQADYKKQTILTANTSFFNNNLN